MPGRTRCGLQLLFSARAVLLALGLAIAGHATAIGNGTFIPHPTTPFFNAGVAGTSIALGDVDGDGDLDAVVANTSSGAETVWLNDGAGNFSAHPTTPSFGAGNSGSIALGDIDGDGDLDAVVTNHTGQAQTVWLNDGDGSFSAHPTTPSFGAGDSTSIALGDIDGDGDLDAVVANDNGQAQTVWRNDGSGNFSAHPTTPSFGAGDSYWITLGDIDGDGDLDAVVANLDAAATVWLNDGGGNFSAHPITPSFGAGNSTSIALGDLDGDGDLDAVATNSLGAETVWLNDGDGNFSAHPTRPSFGFGTSTSIALGDLDGDGDLDAVVARVIEQSQTVWLNDGTGSFSLHPTTPTIPDRRHSRSIALGDIDGDGDLDAVVANQDGQETVWSNVAFHSIAVAANPVAGGTVSCSPNPVVDGTDSTCTATASTGYTFADWSGDCAGATCVLTGVTSPQSVTANFTLNTYAIATAVNPAGAGTVSCTPNPVDHGTDSTCTATPNAGYTFANWSGDCAGASCTLAGVVSARSVTANFTLDTYAIATAVNPAGAGTVTCTPNPVGHGGTSTCSASANPGFVFTAWSGDCTGATCTLPAVTSAKSVTATFTATVRDFSGPSATGSGTITASFTGGGPACSFATSQFIAAPPGSPPVPPTKPVEVTFPHGLFDFTTSGCTPGDTITVTITYPTALPPGTLYWKYGPEPGNATPHWYVMPATIAGNTVTFSITDGMQGDDDLTANGTIVDQGGPGVPGTVGPVPVPTLSQWALVLMASLMLVVGWVGFPTPARRGR